MPRFDPDDYVEVKDRIVEFWEKYPDGAIITELIYVDDRVVRVKALVYANPNEPKPIGTGHAEEYRITEADIKADKRKAYEPNVTSAVENCETSAVGRALAMAGFKVSKSVASRQEMEKVARQEAAREAREESRKESKETLDKPQESAKVQTNGGNKEHLSPEEARKLAGQIKATSIEMGAVELKLVGMGIEKGKTLSETLRSMTKDEALDLYSWVQGEQEK